jgi:acetyl-CoA carboxylase biotin carboxyl carrier protein
LIELNQISPLIMETKEIQKLIDFISNSGLDEVSIETSELKLSIKRYGASATIQAPVMMAAPMPQAQIVQAPALAPIAVAAAPVAEVSSNLVTIKSPMIGTFYATSKPDTPPFVSVGTEIKPGKVLCIVEAMKLFNEIESEISGKIVKILVESNSPIEYDQPLFLVEPN